MSIPRSVMLYALALALITSLPYLVGWFSTPVGGQYSGAAASPAGIAVDFNSHMAKMWQGQRGQLAYQLLFTHEPHPGILGVQGFYVLLGALSFLPFPIMYHLARFLLTAVMVIALWRMAARFFEKPFERWTCLLLATLATGYGWVLFWIAPEATRSVAPIEFWLIDAYNLFGALYMPHFVAAVTLQIIAVLSFDSWVRTQGTQPRTLFLLTLVLAALSLIQPYIILLSGGLLGLLTLHHVFIARRLPLPRALWLAIPLGVHAVLVLYQYFAINADPIWRQFSAQNITDSPPLLYYLLGYLPFLLPILSGARRFLREKPDDVWLIPLVWVGLVILLLYIPGTPQRRYLLGVQTPLAALTAYGWTRTVILRAKPRLRPLWTSVYVTFAALPLALMLLTNITALSNPTRTTDVFYTSDEIAAYAWLRQNAAPDQIVLTVLRGLPDGRGSGGRLTAVTGQRVYIGHWIETADFANKQANIDRFYDPATPDEWRQTFLRDNNIAYVWYDHYARNIGAWTPDEAEYLSSIFETETVTIYQVVLDQ